MPAEDSRAELAPRDVVARAIVRCMERTQHPNVYLDLSHLDPTRCTSVFPASTRCVAASAWTSPPILMPVRPGAHYMIGGVTVDAAGPHDAAGPVGGGRGDFQRPARGQPAGVQQSAGRSGLRHFVRPWSRGRGGPDAGQLRGAAAGVPTPEPRERAAKPLDVADVTNSLRSLMVRHMGIVRDRDRLAGSGAGRGLLVPLCPGPANSHNVPAGSCRTC